MMTFSLLDVEVKEQYLQPRLRTGIWLNQIIYRIFFFTIFLDSLSCLLSLQKMNLDQPYFWGIINKYFYWRKQGKSINICWIPNHIGNQGNTKAAMLKKEHFRSKLLTLKFHKQNLNLQLKSILSLFGRLNGISVKQMNDEGCKGM